MVNVSKFLKNHTCLCVGTLGLAVVGYLGYHAVRWIVNGCQRTVKVHCLGKKAIHDPSASIPKSLINRINAVEISPDKIKVGQGEYVVFHKLPNGDRSQVSRETFDKVYKILIKHSPAAMVDRGEEAYESRYDLLTAKLKEIDPTLEAVFVPRTLYELVFIRSCIEEDVSHLSICSQLDPLYHKITVDFFRGDETKYKKYLEDRATERAARNCWHLCYFTDGGDNEHAGVKEVAYRLNDLILTTFDPPSEGFTHQEFSALAEREIIFLQNHHKTSLNNIERQRKGEKIPQLIDCTKPGPTTNFGCESTRGSIKPMGIRNDADAQIIRDALALDCSRIAEKSLFLYRGADFQKDATYCWSDNNTPYSLSLGTGLFAGCLYDGGAAAFYYMRNGKNAYAIPVPFDLLKDSPFYVPTTHTVAQLFGDGEKFHARTKVWKDFDVTQIGGMNLGANSQDREHLKSQLSQADLQSQFQEYKNRAIQLK